MILFHWLAFSSPRSVVGISLIERNCAKQKIVYNFTTKKTLKRNDDRHLNFNFFTKLKQKKMKQLAQYINY